MAYKRVQVESAMSTLAVPETVYEHLTSFRKNHEAYIDAIQEHYSKCASSVHFLFDTLNSAKEIVQKHGVQYTMEAIAAARGKLMPILETFHDKKETTEKSASAILLIVLEYIEKMGMHVETVPSLATYGINAFLMLMAGSIIVTHKIKNIV